jgi:hypothetical protein
MERRIPWLWITIGAFVLLAPGLAGRFAVDLLEGVTLLVVLGPLLLAGAGLLAWQVLKRRMVTCAACGAPSFGAAICPACGAGLDQAQAGFPPQGFTEQPASDAVIDVVVTPVDEER